MQGTTKDQSRFSLGGPQPGQATSGWTSLRFAFVLLLQGTDGTSPRLHRLSGAADNGPLVGDVETKRRRERENETRTGSRLRPREPGYISYTHHHGYVDGPERKTPRIIHNTILVSQSEIRGDQTLTPFSATRK